MPVPHHSQEEGSKYYVWVHVMGKCAEAAVSIPLLILISQHSMQETSEKTETHGCHIPVALRSPRTGEQVDVPIWNNSEFEAVTDNTV